MKQEAVWFDAAGAGKIGAPQCHGQTLFYAIMFGLAASLPAASTGLMDGTGIKKKKPAWSFHLKKAPSPSLFTR